MRTHHHPQERIFPSEPVSIWVELGKFCVRTAAPFTANARLQPVRPALAAIPVDRPAEDQARPSC